MSCILVHSYKVLEECLHAIVGNFVTDITKLINFYRGHPVFLILTIVYIVV
jgi:hypothetical protein